MTVKGIISVVVPQSVTHHSNTTICAITVKRKIKAVVVKAPKRRNIVALHAKMRTSAGPMADTNWHALCNTCDDTGAIYDGKSNLPCPNCQDDTIDEAL